MECVDKVIEKICGENVEKLDCVGLDKEVREDIKILAILESAREKDQTIDFLKPRNKTPESDL